MRQRPDMPRWKTRVSQRSVSISPYLARRRRPVIRAPVSRCLRSGGNGRRRSGRRKRIDAIRLPSSTGARPRTVISTSGSSGMRDDKGGAHLRSPLLEPRAMDKVSFGREDVAPQEKTRRVGAVFSSVASSYDLMNDLMSGGQHRLWKRAFVRKVAPRKGEAILDMAGGTGDVAFRLAAAGAAVTVADINPDMLAVGMERARTRGI